jgi:hypothetical protein
MPLLLMLLLLLLLLLLMLLLLLLWPERSFSRGESNSHDVPASFTF